tara:strand:+ start:114677 stop:115420 length:744 start_codon:yes stop_codon:yes gene_type:complete
MKLEGTPSEQLPDVLATGKSTASYVLVSLSGREPEGRDAEYIEWHSLDHRPEQYRLAGLRHSIRLVSTPACRAVRAANEAPYDQVDHVMNYMFTDKGEIPGFNALGFALHEAGRMPLRLPSIGFVTGVVASKIAAPSAVAGADVIPWRPSIGVYLIVEEGQADASDLIDVPGVAGVWSIDGQPAPEPYEGDFTGTRITYCFLDQDPIATAKALGEQVRKRWESGAVRGLLAAPFFVVVPFDWDRYLP